MLVSKAELKHTNDKVIVTVYLYNRQKTYYINRLLKVKGAIAYTIEQESFFLQKKERKHSNLVLKNVKMKALSILSKVYRQRKILFKTLKEDNKFERYENKYLKNFILKCLQKEMLLMYHKQVILLNKSKFEKTYLSPLTGLIRDVYNKKVEFNLVNLKYLYLNSYLFSETLITKIRNKKNRLLRVLKASLRMFHLAPLDKLSLLADISNIKKKLQNSKVSYLGKGKISDKISENLQKVYKKKSFNILNYDKIQTDNITIKILDSIKHKSVTGIRIEAAGRLTRRNNAAKSVFKLKYKGNLKNINSSLKGFSSVLLRGYAKSNVQYTKLKSKLRIGSFGLKAWVSAN